VTLIVGIICKDGIVLAADSQTTRGASKQSGTDKINVIEFANGKALMAESGSAALSGRVIEIFQKKSAATKITDESTISKLAEESLREVRLSITSLHPEKNTSEDWQDYFGREINYFELMLAYYFNRKPHLYIFNPLWAIPVKSSSYFATSGIAAELANYILREHTEPKMDSEFASVIAIKVVEDAIEYVEGCGSPPRVALIQPPIEVPDLLDTLSGKTESAGYSLRSYSYHTSEPVTIFPQEKVEEIAKIISSVEQKSKNTQNKKIHQALRSQTEKAFKEFLKDWKPRLKSKSKK
jgi:20S proteasome alpha/beta subunit